MKKWSWRAPYYCSLARAQPTPRIRHDPCPGQESRPRQAAPGSATRRLRPDETRASDAIRRFGNPHLAAARATKKPCIVLSLPGIALDVDCPSDLQQLASAPGDTRAQRLAREWELLDLALAANQ